MPRILVLLFYLLAMLASAGTTLAQQIQGQIRYADSAQPAHDVPINCDGTGGRSQQLTDRQGKFYFRVSPGHYTVSIHVPGYQDEQRSYDLIDSTSSEYVIFQLRATSPAAKTPAANAPLADPNAPPEANAEFQKAETSLQSGKRDEAIQHLEKAITIYPKFLPAQLKLGTVYMDMQAWDKAEHALKKALGIDPKTVNALFALGEIYLRQKKYDEAEKVLQQGISVEPKSPRAHLTLARVYWERVAGVKEEEKWRPPLEKSYQEVKVALELDPNLAEAHLLKGNLFFKVRRAEDALHEFEEYLRLDPKGQFADQTRALAEKIKKALAEAPNKP